MPGVRAVVAMLPAVMLAACNSGAPEPAGGVSEGEAEALAAAAEMLDETPPASEPAQDEVAPAELTGDTAR